jgi:serine/threonine protein phosphatase 1
VSTEIAFVGDVHGNLSVLRGIVDVLAARCAPHAIFPGDYINKGRQSADVMQELISYSQAGSATLLRGNHEAALLDALDTGNLAAFLRMGGAMTIRSYVRAKVGPDVLRDFRAIFPAEHMDAIRRMPQAYETDTLIAQHIPPAASTPKFRISSHVPIGELPGGSGDTLSSWTQDAGPSPGVLRLCYGRASITSKSTPGVCWCPADRGAVDRAWSDRQLIEQPLRSPRTLLIPHRTVHLQTGTRMRSRLPLPTRCTAALGKQEQGDGLTPSARDLTVQSQGAFSVRHALVRLPLPETHLRGQYLGIGMQRYRRSSGGE